jgi:hypothetical protein
MDTENQEQQRQLENTDEQLFLSCVRRSAYFKKELLKAFKHGQKFEQIESKCEIDYTNKEDKHLPFYEWFAKYYA